MTITNIKPDQASGAIAPADKPISTAQRKVSLEVKQPPGEASDKVELSPASKELHQIYSFLQNIPEQKSAKIAKLKELIVEGKYKVDAQELADKLIKDFLPEILK